MCRVQGGARPAGRGRRRRSSADGSDGAVCLSWVVDAAITPPSSVPVDLRLKEGEKLRLNVRAFDSSHKHKQAAAAGSSKLPHPPAEGGGFGALLPPPPKAAPPAAISPLAPPPQYSPAKAVEGSTEGSGPVEQGQKQEEDDWGDFTSASPTT